MKKVIWLTGLSGAGKTTIAEKVIELGYNATKLDGDIMRKGLCKDLGYTIDDRRENIRRVAEVSKILIKNNINCICSFISPTKEIRDLAKEIIGEQNFIEVHIDTPLNKCIERDTKGYYKKAKSGQLKNFTGINSVYEPPIQPNIKLNCFEIPPLESAKILFEYLNKII